MRFTRSLAALAATAFCAAIMASTLFASQANAQDRETPYWATMRFDEVNMRVGPSQEYPIEWVYQRKGLPVKVVRLRGGWRLVQDNEGTQGWIASSQLSPSLGALIVGDGPVELRSDASASSSVRWRAQPGVVGDLLRCRENYCEIDVAGRSGWVVRDRIWGAGDMEPAP